MDPCFVFFGVDLVWVETLDLAFRNCNFAIIELWHSPAASLLFISFVVYLVTWYFLEPNQRYIQIWKQCVLNEWSFHIFSLQNKVKWVSYGLFLSTRLREDRFNSISELFIRLGWEVAMCEWTIFVPTFWGEFFDFDRSTD